MAEVEDREPSLKQEANDPQKKASGKKRPKAQKGEQDLGEEDVVALSDDEEDSSPRKRARLDLSLVYEYLSTVPHQYPAGMKSKGKKANFKRQCRPFRIIKKKLWWIDTDRSGPLPFQEENLEELENTQLYDKGFRMAVISIEEREKIIEKVHKNADTSSEAAAMHSHHGRDKSQSLLSHRYYWSGMLDEMRAYCVNCIVCAKENTSILKVVPKLRPISMPPKVMTQIGVDIVTLPEVDTYSYVYVAIDFFSKWVEARPAPNKDAYGVARWLWEDIICRHGCPKIQINDQGREFVNKVSEELHRLSGTDQRVTSPYHPQCNGMTEKQNHTIKRRLTKSLKEIKDWPYALPGVLFACRTATHSATKFSPFYLMYLRHAILPMDLKDIEDRQVDVDTYLKLTDDGIDDDALDEEHFEKVLSSMLSVRKGMHDLAMKNIKHAQDRYKLNFDKRNNTEVHYNVGDVVFLEDPKQKGRKGKGDSLTKRRGPFQIVEIIDDSRVSLKNMETGNVLKNHYTMEHIFACKTSKEEEEDDDKIFHSSTDKVDKSNEVDQKGKKEDKPANGDIHKPLDKGSGEPGKPCGKKDKNQENGESSDNGGPNPEVVPPAPLGILRNGNMCGPVAVKDMQYTLTNTCAFDSLMQILSDAYKRSDLYQLFIQSNAESDTVCNFIQTLAEKGPTLQAYKQRACILAEHFESLPQGCSVTVNAVVNLGSLVEKVFGNLPSAYSEKMCDGQSCPKSGTRNSTAQQVLFMNEPEEGIGALSNAVTLWTNRKTMGKCHLQVKTQKVDTPDVINYERALRCNGNTTVGRRLSGTHLFIEVTDKNDEKLIECSVVLGSIPKVLEVSKNILHLRGVVEFRGTRKATRHSVGHYVGHSLVDDKWVQYDDLAKEAVSSNPSAVLRSHLIVYSV